MRSSRLVFAALALIGGDFGLALGAPVDNDETPAIKFLDSKTSRIPESLGCFNCETLMTWLHDGKPAQKWKKVRSNTDGYCVYSGMTANPEYTVPDPDAWQRDASVRIPDRDFYSVDLGNDRYKAEFTDKSRFREDAGKKLKRVARTISTDRPDLFVMMLGEFFVKEPVADFIRRPENKVIEFEDGTREGRPVKRLAVRGRISEGANPQAREMSYFTWLFDAETGHCVYATGGHMRRDKSEGECAIEYDIGNQWFPTKIISKMNAHLPVQTIYVRNCTTECLMDRDECFLSYHGFKEPTFETSADTSAARKHWLMWANVGIILIILGLLLRRRLQKSGGPH